MTSTVRFAIASDLHISLPHTIWDHPSRFHLVEVSIPAFEVVLAHLATLDIDFLLLPGDLTQHGERDNHQWLADRLSQLPYPVYVVPGNHDILSTQGSDRTIAAQDFPVIYRKFGYGNTDQLYYSHQLTPHLRLIGLNSIAFDAAGQQCPLGRVDESQLDWLAAELQRPTSGLTLAMIHHNVIDHLPGQRRHVLGRRYILQNAIALQQMLRSAGVPLVFTGHLHIQDIAQRRGLYDITTGSLVSYPHPYRICHLHCTPDQRRLEIESHPIASVPHWEDLQTASREWMGDRADPFMLTLLTHPPFNLSAEAAAPFVPHLRYFWAEIAKGDACFAFPALPDDLRQQLEQFNAIDAEGRYTPIDNHAVLTF